MVVFGQIQIIQHVSWNLYLLWRNITWGSDNVFCNYTYNVAGSSIESDGWQNHPSPSRYGHCPTTAMRQNLDRVTLRMRLQKIQVIQWGFRIVKSLFDINNLTNSAIMNQPCLANEGMRYLHAGLRHTALCFTALCLPKYGRFSEGVRHTTHLAIAWR